MLTRTNWSLLLLLISSSLNTANRVIASSVNAQVRIELDREIVRSPSRKSAGLDGRNIAEEKPMDR